MKSVECFCSPRFFPGENISLKYDTLYRVFANICAIRWNEKWQRDDSVVNYFWWPHHNNTEKGTCCTSFFGGCFKVNLVVIFGWVVYIFKHNNAATSRYSDVSKTTLLCLQRFRESYSQISVKSNMVWMVNKIDSYSETPCIFSL